MTSDPRRAAEMAVIEAARALLFDPNNFGRLKMEVRALDALSPPPPPGETERERVRVAVYRWPSGAIDTEVLAAGLEPRIDAPYVAIITADIPTKLPAPPEVAGSVEAPT